MYKEKPKEFKADGVLAISNYGGYEIQISDDGRSARVRLNDGDHATRSRWQEIKYDNDGGAFVTFHGRKLMLKDFMTTNL
jgi:hypothetical protein